MKTIGWNRAEEYTRRRCVGWVWIIGSIAVWVIMTVSALGDVLGAPAAAAAAMREPTAGWRRVVDWVMEDTYYSRCVPVLIPGGITYVYFNWLSARFFEHT